MRKGILIFALILTLLAGCTGQGTGPDKDGSSDAPDLVPMKIGQLGGQGMPEIHALYNGYYDDEGLDIEWISFTGGSSVVQAAVSGDIDGGIMGSTPALIRAVSQGAPLKVVAVGERETKERPMDMLVVPKDSDIQSVADLRGKTIAVHRLGTSLDLILRVALEEEGIVPDKDANIVQVKFSQIPTALLNGEVDAAFVLPVSYAPMKDEVRTIMVPGDVFEDGVLYGVVFFRQDYLDAHPEEVRRFVEAYLKGISWGDVNHEGVYEQYVQDTGADMETAKAMAFPAFNPSGRVPDAAFEDLIDAIKTYDPDSLGSNVTVEDFVDYRYLP